MPIVEGNYVAPIWRNDAEPAISADEMQAISDTLEKVNEMPRIYLETAVLVQENWTMPDGETRFQQTVSAFGVTPETKIILVDADLSTEDDEERAMILTGWAGPSENNVVQGNGTLTFFSYSLPHTSIPIMIGVLAQNTEA